MQTKHASQDYVTVGEAAAIATVSTDTIKRWEKAGKIAALRTPTGHRRFLRSDVEALLQPTRARDERAFAVTTEVCDECTPDGPCAAHPWPGLAADRPVAATSPRSAS